MYSISLLTFILLAIYVSGEENCSRPQELMDKEEHCLDSKTTFFDRVQHKATGLFATAKKKLGIDEDAAGDPLKCDYYYCVLRNIKMVNDYGIFEINGFNDWIKAHVPNEYQEDISKLGARCFQSVFVSGISNDDETNCRNSLEYVRCLSEFDKCQIFKYP